MTNVDDYILEQATWAQEKLIVLRDIILGCDLHESIKWGAPVYVHKSNVLGIAAFKNHVALWFFQGVFLKDSKSVLLAAQDNTKALRQWRFLREDKVDANLVKQYVLEAVANDEIGLKIAPAKKVSLAVPLILSEALNSKSLLLETFNKMSGAKQREFCEYIAEAKQDATRQRRVQKSIELILANKGLHDKYKK